MDVKPGVANGWATNTVDVDKVTLVCAVEVSLTLTSEVTITVLLLTTVRISLDLSSNDDVEQCMQTDTYV